jgi:large subunit ribosomal protein L9
MEVILLERIARLGQMGDVVRVKDGYARNFLLPRGKALRANEANKKRFESDRSHLEARNLEQRQEAEAASGKINGQAFIVIRQAGETGQLYGSVSARDIVEAMEAGGTSIQRSQVALNQPIKAIGLHEVKIALHPEVDASVTINVARSEDEALRQARGEDLTRGERDEGRDEDAGPDREAEPAAGSAENAGSPQLETAEDGDSEVAPAKKRTKKARTVESGETSE